MNITIFGATGFIGKELVKYLIEKNYNVSIVTRSKEKSYKKFDPRVTIYDYTFSLLLELINQSDVIINLAGENISKGIWTLKRKQQILDSRIKIGNLICMLCENAKSKPRLLIQASAIGFYGYNVPSICNEKSAKGKGFLADVCEKWEQSTEPIIKYGIKRSVIRTGIVLGNSGGLFPKLLLPFKFFTAILIGNGNNYLSWIHINDEIRAIEHIITNSNPATLYNLTAPNPTTMTDIVKELSGFTKPIIRLKIPDKILTRLLGDQAKELLLANQQIAPLNLIIEDFKFSFEISDIAIYNLLNPDHKNRITN